MLWSWGDSMNEPSPVFLSSPDLGGRGAGAAIKRARESQGITLESLASMIKVTPAKLDALEQGRYDLLPDANFTRALAMTVCRVLKIDVAEVLTSLPAAKPTPLAEGKPPLNQPFRESKGGTPLFDRNSLNWPGLLTLKYLAPMVLLIGAVLIYALPESTVMPSWLSPSRPPAQSVVNIPANVTQTVPVMPRSASTVQASVPSSASASSLALDAPESASASGALPAPAQPSVPLTPAMGAPLQSSTTLSSPSTAAPGVTQGASAGSLTVALTVASWIEVRDARGNRLIARVAQPGENLSLNGPAPLQVRIGHVSGVQMRFKGQPVDLSPFTRNNVARIELK
jgi:cytoskeleton protein RodZ